MGPNRPAGLWHLPIPHFSIPSYSKFALTCKGLFTSPFWCNQPPISTRHDSSSIKPYVHNTKSQGFMPLRGLEYGSLSRLLLFLLIWRGQEGGKGILYLFAFSTWKEDEVMLDPAVSGIWSRVTTWCWASGGLWRRETVTLYLLQNCLPWRQSAAPLGSPWHLKAKKKIIFYGQKQHKLKVIGAQGKTRSWTEFDLVVAHGRRWARMRGGGNVVGKIKLS